MILEFDGGGFGGEDAPVVGWGVGWLVVVDFLRVGWGTVGWDEFGVAGVETVAYGAVQEDSPGKEGEVSPEYGCGNEGHEFWTMNDGCNYEIINK